MSGFLFFYILRATQASVFTIHVEWFLWKHTLRGGVQGGTPECVFLDSQSNRLEEKQRSQADRQAGTTIAQRLTSEPRRSERHGRMHALTVCRGGVEEK